MTTETKQALGGILIAILIASGLAWAGSQNGHSYSGIPVFAVGVAVAFAINWIAFIPAFIKRTEKFYDLTGGIAYIAVIATAVKLSSTVDARTMLLAGMVAVWAIRLSSFLFLRI
ncbi:MAG: DUF1295 domain-containing protein, partial [Anaerolineales bacterium]|nr:DUF1295 domain-containing protein [Anaerolineales bacterium]